MYATRMTCWRRWRKSLLSLLSWKSICTGRRSHSSRRLDASRSTVMELSLPASTLGAMDSSIKRISNYSSNRIRDRSAMMNAQLSYVDSTLTGISRWVMRSSQRVFDPKNLSLKSLYRSWWTREIYRERLRTILWDKKPWKPTKNLISSKVAPLSSTEPHFPASPCLVRQTFSLSELAR